MKHRNYLSKSTTYDTCSCQLKCHDRPARSTTSRSSAMRSGSQATRTMLSANGRDQGRWHPGAQVRGSALSPHWKMAIFGYCPVLRPVSEGGSRRNYNPEHSARVPEIQRKHRDIIAVWGTVILRRWNLRLASRSAIFERL